MVLLGLEYKEEGEGERMGVDEVGRMKGGDCEVVKEKGNKDKGTE